MGGYGETKLPAVVLDALEGGESRWGRIIMWMTAGLFAFMVVMFFVTPEPMEEKLPTVPYVAGSFAVFFGLGFFISRKRHRVGHSGFARLLRTTPEKIAGVEEEAVQPSPGGRVQRTAMKFDGEREFSPREKLELRVLGVRVLVRSFIYIKIDGRLWRQKLVVPFHDAPTLLSYLFALASKHNPECRWGEGSVSAPR